MQQPSSPQFLKEIEDAIEQAIEKFVAKKWEEKIRELEQEKERYLAGICLNVFKQISISEHGSQIVISVNSEK